MRLKIDRARRAWTLAGGTLALAAGAMVLLRAPEPVGALPIPTPGTPTPITATTSPAGPARVDLRGAGIDGFFAFTEGAMLANGARSLFAELRLEGAQVGTVQRSPVALAVALDHSGSMTGEKIEQARESVVALLGRMHDDDLLSIVIYDQSAIVLQSLAPVRELRSTLPSRVRAITADGGTNIPLGLDLAASTLASAPPRFVRRLVLVSDGVDGSGETIESIASRVAARANERVTTSSLGIGIDYDEHFLSSVADAGRGNYAFLATGSQLEPFLRAEIEQASTTVADGVVATIDLPPDARVRRAHGIVASGAGRITLPIGSLFAGERRKIVLEIDTVAGAPGAIAAARVGLHWLSAADQRAHTIDGAIASVRVVATAGEVDASRDVELHADAVATAVDADQADAMAAWRAGRSAEAIQATDARLHVLREAQRAAPASASVAARITELEHDRASFAQESAGSAAGRAYGLSRGSTRRQAAEAY